MFRKDTARRRSRRVLRPRRTRRPFPAELALPEAGDFGDARAGTGDSGDEDSSETDELSPVPVDASSEADEDASPVGVAFEARRPGAPTIRTWTSSSETEVESKSVPVPGSESSRAAAAYKALPR